MASWTASSRTLSALGRSVAFVLGMLLSIGAARAGIVYSESELIKLTPDESIPVDVGILDTEEHGRVTFFITKGLSGDCGRLYEVFRNAVTGKDEAILRYTFTAKGKAGCNPVGIRLYTTSLDSGGTFDYVAVTTSEGGQNGTGATMNFYIDDNKVVSIWPNAAGGTPVGNTVGAAPSEEAPAVRAATRDALYVTTSNGGTSGNGAIYASAISNAGILSAPKLVFSFPGGARGAQPLVPAVAGPDGFLYGTTFAGGSANAACTQFTSGCGIVYQLTPPAGAGSQWHENILHIFALGKDFAFPIGRLAFDADGNVYGTASAGGRKQAVPSGGVFMLMPERTFPWTMTQLYVFSGGDDGSGPHTGVTLDAHGNVFGTTQIGGAHFIGVIFKLQKPAHQSDAFWKEEVLHSFAGAPSDGAGPSGEVALVGEDVFGTTFAGGETGTPACQPDDPYFNAAGCGTVFELTPK